MREGFFSLTQIIALFVDCVRDDGNWSVCRGGKGQVRKTCLIEELGGQHARAAM